MRIAIIGLQHSGKTTVFNALTGQHAETSAFGGRMAVHQAIVKVPDPRLDKLSEMFKPKKHTPATVEYIDLAGIVHGEGSHGEGLGDKQLTEIAPADALLVVIRGFKNEAGEPADPEGDASIALLEIALSDLKKIDNRIEKLNTGIPRAPIKERPALEAELETMKRLKEALEAGRPARAVEIPEEQGKALRGFQLLTMKPMMIVINEGEEEWSADKDKPARLAAVEIPGTRVERLCGLMEAEIARLELDDRAVFLQDYGIAEPAAHRVIRLCYELLGKMSFLTVGPDECRAWTINQGTHAQQAAGAIHSDLERGFIRAEVINWKELIDLGSYAEAKRKGKLRVEGKSYVVQDGDVINVLFSV